MGTRKTQAGKPERSMLPAIQPIEKQGPYKKEWLRRWQPQHHPGESYVAASDIFPRALESILGLYYQKLEQLFSEMLTFSQEFRELGSRLSQLEETISERPVVGVTFLSSLANQELELSRWIPIVLEQFDEEAVARWPEVEATGIGATEFEAIESLRKDIAELFEDLSSSDSSELSDQTAGALAVLRSVIEKRG